MSLRIEIEGSSVWLAPLVAGGAFVLIWLLTGHAVTALSRWLAARDAPVQRRRPFWQWPGWGTVGRLIATLYAVGFLTLALLRGWAAPGDVGLRAPPWASLAAWVPPLLALMALGLGLQWGAGWWQLRSRDTAAFRNAADSFWELPTQAVGHEATLAILRAALAPVVGGGYGLWLAPALKGGLALLSPGSAAALRHPARRPWALLPLALDWLSTALWMVTGSVWPGLLARLGESLALLLLYALLRHRTAPPETGV